VSRVVEVRSWRIHRDDGGHYYMFFDAATEAPLLRSLTEEERSEYLDSVVSVSGIDRDRDQIDLLDGCEGPSDEGLLPF